MLDLADIIDARRRISDHVHLTPTFSSTMLGDRVGSKLFLKCENFQKTGSYKTRGALNRVMQLDAAERERGVVTVSAGNHAQALAWSSRAAGVKCTVVMPTRATRAKVDASRGYGADVVLFGESSIQAFERAHQIEQERGLVFVSPFDDDAIVAGAGTVALELLEQVDDLDVVVIPVGGGGLLAGMATAIKALKPSIRVYGVEPEGAASMRMSLDAGRPIRLESVKTIADGLAAPMAGELTYEITRRLVDDVVLVSDDQITDALEQLMIYTKLVAEPAGAASLAAILSGAVPHREGERIASIVSGGNVDLSLFAAMRRRGDAAM